MSAFWSMLQRELVVAYRRRTDLLNPLLFFLMVITLFPMGVTPDMEKLGELSAGILWVAALLATLLSLDMMFRADFDDGTLEQILLSNGVVEWRVLAKMLTHWLVTGLPLTLISPALSLMLALPGRAVPALMLSLGVGTLALSLIGSVGAALTVGLRKGGLLLSLLVMPLFIPVLIFGASAVASAALGLGFKIQLLYICAISLVALALAPWITTVALRISVNQS
ncbi:heme exporter protein CcmB [Gynuella sunshinyii]|uniref:Heme exporter protein B n=1 Tax=Gynuella sunshinyii YC6258 TaxID=1445510 RepID=A0A0C5VBL8_9GAMM|nr:heme exporter protein CcmB [Gynuella sunshinyii]AJQ96725.1 ABC-type transport system involved in cytochrome c biogenesis, permease component [Gynuella sunshinyii YC6258]